MANDGIIKSKEGITLPVLSLGIWILTGIIYKLLAIPFKSINYYNAVFITSLLFSVICGFTFLNDLLKKNSQPSRLFLILLNIILLFASANGYQQGYSFIASNPDQKETKAGFFTSILDPRPWIPDKLLQNKNNELITENENRKDTINKISIENKSYKIKITARENQIRNISLNGSAQIRVINNLTNENINLKNANAQLHRKINDHNNLIRQFVRYSEERNVKPEVNKFLNSTKKSKILERLTSSLLYSPIDTTINIQ
ncbi:MAG: hypothetical protein NTZ33_02095 [Bacteroidetes bacterium]|nr:hypothetical protein [Bacteroidota bacterium]